MGEEAPMPRMELLYDHLETSARHLAKGSARVARQRIIVEEMRSRGSDMIRAEETLQVLRAVLRTMREHERILREELALMSNLQESAMEARGGAAGAAQEATFPFLEPPSPQLRQRTASETVSI